MGPVRAEWGWGGVGTLRLGPGYKDGPSGASSESGRVGPSRAQQGRWDKLLTTRMGRVGPVRAERGRVGLSGPSGAG